MKFDLTTPEGKESAKNLAIGVGFGLPGLAIKKVFDYISDKDTIIEQRETAVEVIKAGKANGVDEMEVTLEQDAGINIAADLVDIPIKTKIGKDGKMNIKVKYK